MVEKKQLIRSKAPLRISFAGGGTDVPPYCDERGGAVLNSTIDRFAYCTISPRKDKEITIRSLDYGIVEKWQACGDMFAYDGNLDLIKAVLNHFEVDRGFDMFLHCEAPPGSGLGSSSTVIVSIIGAMAEWLNEPLSQYDIAHLAYVLERKELGLAGGKQDQYAAVFGGFNFMEFMGPQTIVTPLRVKTDILNELHYQLLLGNTGKTRDSSNIIKSQTEGYKEKKEQVMDALDNTKRLAIETKDALLRGNIRTDRRAAERVVELQEEVHLEDLQRPHRRDLRRRPGQRRHRGQDLRGRGRRLHVLHLRVRPQAQRGQRARQDGRGDRQLQLRQVRPADLEVLR